MTAPARQRQAPMDFDEFVHEYRHFIGFGNGHHWACQQLGVDPSGTKRRLERGGRGDLIPRYTPRH